MEGKRNRKLSVRFLGLLMSCILLAGSFLSDVQPVYGAAVITTFITNNQKEDAFSFAIEGGSLIVKSIPKVERDKDIYVSLYKMHWSETYSDWVRDSSSLRQDHSVSFPYTVQIPQEDGTYQIIVSMTKDGSYSSYNIRFTIANGAASFEKSKYYDENKKIYKKRHTSDTALGFYLQPMTISESDVPKMRAVAEKVVNKKDSDFVKIQKIHDWVATNIWYDYDLLAGKWDGTGNPGSPLEVLEKKRADCSGYSNLTAELLRSIGIPTIDVTGIAGGAHGWNEAYADGRWIILDTTWDSFNKYKDGVYSEQKPARRTYFDPTLESFSKDHEMKPDEDTPFWMELQFKEDLSISQTSLTLKKGKTKQLSVKKAGKYKYINLKDAKITYSSSNAKVAAVSKKGKITAKKAGTAVITTTVKLEGITLKYKTTVTVKK